MPSAWNAAVLWRNLALGATVTATSSIPGTPPKTVLDEDVQFRWQSQSASDSLIFDLLAAVALDTITLVALTATTIRVRVSATDPTGEAADVYDSEPQAVSQAYEQAIFLLPAVVTGRYVRVDLAHSSKPYVEAGFAVIGARLQFTYNYDWGAGRGRIDPGRRAVTEDHQTQIDRRARMRTAALNFGWVSEADRWAILEEMDREAGLSESVLLIMDCASSDLARDTILGLFDELAPTIDVAHELSSRAISITERR